MSSDRWVEACECAYSESEALPESLPLLGAAVRHLCSPCLLEWWGELISTDRDWRTRLASNFRTLRADSFGVANDDEFGAGVLWLMRSLRIHVQYTCRVKFPFPDVAPASKLTIKMTAYSASLVGCTQVLMISEELHCDSSGVQEANPMSRCNKGGSHRVSIVTSACCCCFRSAGPSRARALADAKFEDFDSLLKNRSFDHISSLATGMTSSI